MREADPFRPLPCGHGPRLQTRLKAEELSRGSVVSSWSSRTVICRRSNQRSSRQEARQARRSRDRVAARRGPRIRRAGGRAGTPRRALGARRQQVEESRPSSRDCPRITPAGPAWVVRGKGPIRVRCAEEGRHSAARNRVALQHAASRLVSTLRAFASPRLSAFQLFGVGSSPALGRESFAANSCPRVALSAIRESLLTC